MDISAAYGRIQERINLLVDGMIRDTINDRGMSTVPVAALRRPSVTRNSASSQDQVMMVNSTSYSDLFGAPNTITAGYDGWFFG